MRISWTGFEGRRDLTGALAERLAGPGQLLSARRAGAADDDLVDAPGCKIEDARFVAGRAAVQSIRPYFFIAPSGSTVRP